MADLEDEDSWLYGDAEKKSQVEEVLETVGQKDETNDAVTTDEPLPEIPNGKASSTEETKTTTNGQSEIVNETKNDDDEDDSDDDDVQVTIGEITTGPAAVTFPPTGLRTFYRNPVPIPPKPSVTKGLNMEAPGDINGKPVMDTNLDMLDDKPWRKPGADISDYFNYGFNEDTWKQYCDKQKKLRSQMDNTPIINLPLCRPPINNGIGLFPTPPYVPKFENTVRSISTLQVSRRKEEELLGLAGGEANGSSGTTTSVNVISQSPSGSVLPPVAIPRPGGQVFIPNLRPPVSGALPSAPLPFPPMNPNQPPPGLPIGVPPPGFLLGVPPPGIPPPNMVPPPEYLQSSAMGFPPGVHPPTSHAAPYNHDGDPRYNEENRDRDRPNRPSDNEGERHSEEDSRYRRDRGSSSRRDYDRDRDRDRYRDRRDYRESRTRDRDRDRDRERERDRDRDRERERDRDRRENSSSRRYKDDSPSRRRSTRRKHEDDDRHSSKNKKAKKHKHKDRDSDAPPGTDEGGGSDEQNKG